MNKRLISILICAHIFIGSAGISYALRPMAEANSRKIEAEEMLAKAKQGQDTQKKAERIKDIQHDVIPKLSYFRAHVDIDIIGRAVRDKEVIVLCKQIAGLCDQLKDASYAVGMNEGDIEQNVSSYTKASKELIELLTPERIDLLWQQRERLDREVFSKPEAEIKKSAWLFENICKAIKLILVSSFDLIPQETKEVNINELLDITSAAEVVWHDLEIQRDYDPQNPATIGNESEIFRVFINLLRNTHEAIRGAKAGTVRVLTRGKKDRIEIRISDTAPGMSKDKVDAFNTGKQVTSSKGEGRGLGLRIVRELVQENGGTIKVESEAGKGSTFAICLPVPESKFSKPILKSLGVYPAITKPSQTQAVLAKIATTA